MLRIWPELADADFVLRPYSSAGVHIAGQQPLEINLVYKTPDLGCNNDLNLLA